MAPISRNPFTAPAKQGRGLWRALAEVTGGALLMLLTQLILRGPGPSDEVRLRLGVLALALIAVRRRFPTMSLLGISVVLGLLPAAGLPAAMAAYTTVKHLTAPRRRSAVLLASAVLATLTCAAFAPHIGFGSHSFGLAVGAVLAATTLVVPGLLGSSGGQEDRLLRALRERAAAAEAARRLAESESRIHERSRIAAEMHDLIGHRLSVISLHTGGLEMALQQQSPELRDEAALVRRSVAEAMRELREVLGVLGPLERDTGTDALTDTTGTRSDVEALAEESRSGGIPVDLTWEGPDLDDRAAQVRRAVHRVVRESLTNVHRYAPGARVTVAVTHTDDRVAVLVRNGLPPVAPPAETGLGTGRGHVGLRERVALLGGTLEVGPTPAGGFAVTARIPAQPTPGASLAATGAPAPESALEPRFDQVSAGVQRRAVNALSGLLGLIGVGVLMMCGLLLVSQAFPESVSPRDRDPEPPRIGMSRAMVGQAVYGDNPLARAAATGREPAHPPSVTSCMYSTMSFDHSTSPTAGAEQDPEHFDITRYCFRGDTLATIDRFTVPMVSRTPPWETP
ncbi:sensor histidine kinase [Kitasatospora kifunensis]|uniref:histidine kinase n=1 Tax=Kitasatospora kifunensis TaxID=58351 RepID=A0A7W7RB73_KITKI|nr:histidine kinase [Kitasatospora kifunensis]MBB4928777.1 signal transduction histidine kinase [Kitasatospora kifunensis]